MLTSVIIWITVRITLIYWTITVISSLHTVDTASSHKKTAYVDGDIMIGALFAVHHQPEHRRVYSGDRTCGKIWEEYGIQRLEATLRTIDDINKNPKLLPGVKLGVEIRDDCWYSPVALEQTIEFIRESIAAQTGDMVIPGAELRDAECSPSATASKKKKNFVGIVGPGSSSVAIQVQNLLQLFNIPQIGYSATSPDLSDKTSYKYFLRVVPSDRYQAAAILDLIIHHNWTYISAVCTKGSYGTSGLEAFKSLAKKSGICIATEETIPSNPDEKEYDRVVQNFWKFYPQAKVIACFCEGQTVTGLFKALKKSPYSGKFLLIGSDGWADRTDVVQGVEEEAVGGISIRIQSPYIDWFDDYYFRLSPWTHQQNPWFKEFWSERFNCLLPEPEGSAVSGFEFGNYYFNRTCTGRERLSQSYKQDTKMGFVIDSIYTLAHGLHNMHHEVCNGVPGLCAEMQTINGSLLLDYLMDVNFTSISGHMIHFDENGDPPGRYDIMNFQKRNGKFKYHRVGQWDNGHLRLEQPFQWNRENQHHRTVESVCSHPCKKGEVKAIQTGGVKCCWVCQPCKLNEYLLDEFTCKECPPGWLPNENITACLPIRLEYVSWDSTEAAVGISFSCLGFLATLFTTIVFMMHNNTTVVKASTRELSYMILVGIQLSYATTFPLVAKPSLETCYLTRILPGFSFAMIYGALVTKTNRIARILAAGKKKIMTRKPRFMSALAQVVITWIIIGVEVAILCAMLLKEPANFVLHYPELNRARLICNTTALGIIAPMGFDFFLIVMCTVYAIKTRNLPENFNEAKFIGFTMYTTCVIWLAFVPIYFGSDQKILTMCLCISFSATVALVFLFFPKLYIILLHPERNTRSAFTTTNQVRCHIGSNNITNKSMETSSTERYTERMQGFYRRGPRSSDSLTQRIPTLLQRFNIKKARSTTEVVNHMSSISYDSPTQSTENHVEEHFIVKAKHTSINRANPSKKLPRMSDVMEETSTAFREDPPLPAIQTTSSEAQTGYELLLPIIEQLAHSTPTLRRRRRSLLLLRNEIEEELLSPTEQETAPPWWMTATRSLDTSLPPQSSRMCSRTSADDLSSRGRSSSNATLTSATDDVTVASSRVSLASASNALIRPYNGDTESLRNLKEWLEDQGIRLTDLPTSQL
ncbi:metabotropic glutamate receptor 5-like [Paramacrobiotus metropolitanus]|uniref:metabotropic glutamate receptor 5-like n=1 Tax=Paramacrobiotus metropolitanus TaxID=2943436 RepID=UPI0024458C5B|nr:metabotropic glutamate receptor 5-like [Paramacrobiotus metropolitanus]